MDSEQRNQRIQDFLSREFVWKFSAGECNFLISLLAYLVQDNPAFVPNEKGTREHLNYQNIRSIVLLNEKLNVQLQHYASEAAVILEEAKPASDRVQ